VAQQLYDFSDFGLNDSSELISKMIAQLYLNELNNNLYRMATHTAKRAA